MILDYPLTACLQQVGVGLYQKNNQFLIHFWMKMKSFRDYLGLSNSCSYDVDDVIDRADRFGFQNFCSPVPVDHVINFSTWVFFTHWWRIFSVLGVSGTSGFLLYLVGHSHLDSQWQTVRAFVRMSYMTMTSLISSGVHQRGWHIFCCSSCWQWCFRNGKGLLTWLLVSWLITLDDCEPHSVLAVYYMHLTLVWFICYAYR